MDIPNLFEATKEARRLYAMMLHRLLMHDAFAEMILACEKIRLHARTTVGDNAALFVHIYERDAMWFLGRHAENWERHVRLEISLFGQLVDLTSSNAHVRDISFAAERRAPLHYACGRYAESAECKERKLALTISRVPIEQLFYVVTNTDVEPSHPVCVTLRHIYEKLGKSLTEWEYWRAFVSGVPAPLLTAANTTMEELQSNPTVLAALLTEQRRRRRTIRSAPQLAESPWETVLLKWFPFLRSYPRHT